MLWSQIGGWEGICLAENDIRGVKLFDEPISRSRSAIAVKKGNTDLLGEINAALAEIRRDGTYDRIIQSWQIELGSLVREAAHVFETLVNEWNCRIEIEDLPAIEADGTQMLQLFQHLIGNALKYRGSDTLNIRVYGKNSGNGTCEIYVEDNGIGFDQQFAELIFRPFQRLHGRGKYDGIGMGLAICRKIVERHGGTIRVESEQGKGSTFIVQLPVKQPRTGRGTGDRERMMENG